MKLIQFDSNLSRWYSDDNEIKKTVSKEVYDFVGAQSDKVNTRYSEKERYNDLISVIFCKT